MNLAESQKISSRPAAIVARIVFAAAVIAVGGVFFGYDTGVISGAVGPLKEHFHLSAWQVGLAGSSAILGCIPGSMLGGIFSDRLGRKKTLLLAAVLFAAFGLISSTATLFTRFVMARLGGGVAIGAASAVCPVYIAEIAPASSRGRLGSFFQLAIVASLFFVLLLNFFNLRSHGEVWSAQIGWRWMFGSEALPASLFVGLLLFIPESPRWLTLTGKRKRSRVAEAWFGMPSTAEDTGEDTGGPRTDPAESARFSELFGASFRRPMIIAVCLPALAQFSGINAVMYYAPEVFKSDGATVGSALASTVWVGAMNLLFAFVALSLVDSAGRKPLLLGGAALQTVALVSLGCLFHFGVTGIPVLICVLAFIAAFAMAMGPIPWIVISEIFPSRIRGRAGSIGVLTVWTACYIVAQTFPILLNTVGPSVTFWIYGFFSAGSFGFVLYLFPETMGRRLEDIDATWKPALENSRADLFQ